MIHKIGATILVRGSFVNLSSFWVPSQTPSRSLKWTTFAFVWQTFCNDLVIDKHSLMQYATYPYGLGENP